MKRILRAGILGTACSIFFTGCGSSALVSGSGGEYQEIKWQVIETQETKEDLGEMSLKEGETHPEKVMPDYYEVQSNEKLKELKSVPAFKMKDEHSSDSRDIALFEVGTLQPDGTFIYYYSTKVGTLPEGEEEDNRPIVHCVAAYNYENKLFKVIHEKVFTREESDTAEDDDQSFYMQICSSSGFGDMFVYDNGIGYLYNASGEEIFIASIKEFVQDYFNGYSVVTTEALMEGGDRIYVDIVIEKQEITSVDEQDQTEVSEEEADKEAEALDQEFDEKTIEVVLAYDFQTYDSSIDQTNLMFDVQTMFWQQLGEAFSGEAGEEPSMEEDWASAVETYPNLWGPAYLYGLKTWSEQELGILGIHDPYFGGTPVFQWTGDKTFSYLEGGYVPTFLPMLGTFEPFTELKSNSVLTDVFILHDGKYYELSGITKEGLGEGDYSEVLVSREVTRKDEVTKEDGTTETQDTTITQSMKKYRKRDVYLDDGYLEGYWILDGCNSVFDVVDDDVFCVVGVREEDTDYDEIHWLKSDGNKTQIDRFDADTMVDIYKDNGSLYMAVSLADATLIKKLNNDSKAIESVVTIPANAITNRVKKVDTARSEVDSKYHDAYDKMSAEDEKDTLGQDDGVYLDSENLLRVTLGKKQTELLQQIEDYHLAQITAEEPNNTMEQTKQRVEYNDVDRISEIGTEGYLITSFAHGLLYFDQATNKTISLDDGTWYGTWRNGDSFVSIGFSSGNSSYEAMDMAHARVFEYSLDDLYEKGLKAIVASTGQTLKAGIDEEKYPGAVQMQGELDDKRKDEKVVFVSPEEDEWKDNTPGGEVQKQEQARKESEAEVLEKKEEAGEWDPLDEHWYGEKGL